MSMASDLGGVCAVFKEESNTQLYSKGNNYRPDIIDIMINKFQNQKNK